MYPVEFEEYDVREAAALTFNLRGNQFNLDYTHNGVYYTEYRGSGIAIRDGNT